jgi:hypothetical protein
MERKYGNRTIVTNELFRGSHQQWEKTWTEVLPVLEGKHCILDAGCGEHLWSASDYEVVGCDKWQSYDDRSARPANVVDVDLCGPWPFESGAFSGVTAIELLEHMENPWHIIREATRIASRFVVLSSPAVLSPLSKKIFAATGELWGFTEAQRRNSKHTTPIFPWQVAMMAKACGWKVRKEWVLRDHLAWASDVVPEAVRGIIDSEPVQESIWLAVLVPEAR